MRPTTSNPKRRHTVGSPTHQQQDTPRSHVGGVELGDGKPVHALRLPLAFEDVSAEVLWSSEPTVPQNMLARPHTSNPRYVELNQRDTPRRETGGVVLTSAGGSTSGGASSPQLTPSDNSPDQSKQSQANDGTGVLWACESESIDPALIARPITANPWLRRLFESGAIPEANWSNKGAQILWSSIDVEDWRMLARPHASNPLLERVAADASDVSSARKASEVLWHREEDDTRSKCPQPTAATLSAQPDDDGVVLVDGGDEANQTVEQSLGGAQMASLLLDCNTTNPLILSSLRSQSEKIESLESKVDSLTTMVKDLTELLRTHMVASQGHHGIQFLQQQSFDVNGASGRQQLSISVDPRLNKVSSDKSLGGRGGVELGSAHTLRSDVLTYLPDPTPLSVTIPVIKDQYPTYHAPSPPRSTQATHQGPVVQFSAEHSPAQRHVHYSNEQVPIPIPHSIVATSSAADLDAEEFVVEDNSAIEPRLEGIDDDSINISGTQRKPQHRAYNPALARPESAQPRQHAAGASSGSRVVHHLRESVDSTRPQSAPLNSYRRTGTNNIDAIGVTTTFSKDGSNALLLNNKAIVDQYQKLIRSGHPFALKTDFTEMYRQKSEAFGMPVTNREIERKLNSFRSVGSEYLSFEEFSVLYLHIAQW